MVVIWIVVLNVIFDFVKGKVRAKSIVGCFVELVVVLVLGVVVRVGNGGLW